MKWKVIGTQAMEQGFRAVKVKVGASAFQEDVQRLQAVRSVIGDKGILMVNANPSLTVSEAIRRGKVYEKLGCYWFEEPLPTDDVGGYRILLERDFSVSNQGIKVSSP